jgi:putative ABC transport system permease protein
MRSRLRSLFWRVPVATEVNEELEAHIELQTARYIREGMPPEAARAKAMARFGDSLAVREQCTDIRQDMENDMRRSEIREELRQDTVFALRGFRRAPLFTLVALATIAIGVGANTAIFSVVNTVLLRPLPYANANRNVSLFNSYGPELSDRASVAGGELFDYRETIKSLDAIAAIRGGSPSVLTAQNVDPESVIAYAVTPNLFDVLGVRPILGRSFLPTDGRPNDALVVILSHALWQRRYGGDSSVIGKTLVLNDFPRTIVGVMGPDMRFPDSPVGYAGAKADLWAANTFETTRTPNQRGNQNLVVVGRMREGATQADLTRDLAALDARFKREYPDRYGAEAKHWHTVSISLRDEMIGPVRPALLMLSGAVGLVLLIACVNVANLLLARTALRQRELAVRLALGADRIRLLRQLLTESIILALGGGLLGVGVAWLAVRGLRTYAVVEMPQLAGTSLDLTVLAFSFLISAVAGILIGLVPAFQQAAATPGSVLGESTRGASAGLTKRRLRSALVVAQVAMALVILNTAGLLGRSFAAMQRVEPGFVPDGVMSAYINVPRRLGGAYDTIQKVAAFYERLSGELARLPGVTSVGGVYPLPVSNDGWSGSFDVEGRPEDSREAPPHAEYAAAMPGYFKTMGMRLRGRDFNSDDRMGRPLTVIVDEELARKYWPKEDAIGKRISRDASTGQWMTVIGVVNHVHRDGPTKRGEPQLYLSYLQQPQGMLYAVVKGSADPYALAGSIRQTVKSLDRDLPVSKQRSLADLQHDAIARQRFNLVLTSLFAIAALALASIGLYGVMAYLVAQRTREIGIRVALGGRPSDVRGMILRESMGIAGVGLVIGLAGSLAMSRAMTGFLFQIKATDPMTYGSIALLLIVVASLAAFGPARRATKVDPLTALRD